MTVAFVMPALHRVILTSVLGHSSSSLHDQQSHRVPRLKSLGHFFSMSTHSSRGQLWLGGRWVWAVGADVGFSHRQNSFQIAGESSQIISGVRQVKERSRGQQSTQSSKATAERALLGVHCSLKKAAQSQSRARPHLPEGTWALTEQPQQALALVWLGWGHAPSSTSLPGSHLDREFTVNGVQHSVTLSVIITIKCHQPSPDFHPLLRYNCLPISKREGADSFRKTPHHCFSPSFSITKLTRALLCCRWTHCTCWQHLGKLRAQIFAKHQEIKQVVLAFFYRKYLFARNEKHNILHYIHI